MRNRRSARAGFTLMEIMVVVVIIGLLAALVIGRVVTQGDKAKVTATKAMMTTLETQLDLFKLEFNKYPEAIEDLVFPPSYVPPEKYPPGGFLKEVPLDGWGNKFIYRVPGTNNQPYDLISLGADNKESGEGFDADISRSIPRKQ